MTKLKAQKKLQDLVLSRLKEVNKLAEVSYQKVNSLPNGGQKDEAMETLKTLGSEMFFLHSLHEELRLALRS